jgi:hypothetical protein
MDDVVHYFEMHPAADGKFVEAGGGREQVVLSAIHVSMMHNLRLIKVLY